MIAQPQHFGPLIITLLLASFAAWACVPACADDVDGEKEGAIFVPTPHDVVARMLDVAAVSKDDVLYDLGCGDGRIVIAAAERGCNAVGYEISSRKVRQSIANVKKHGVDALVRIRKQDIYTVDLRKASVVTLYLLPEMNDRLVPQLQKMRDGSRIVAHDFAIEAFQPDRVVSMRSELDGGPHDIYLYTMPLKRKQ